MECKSEHVTAFFRILQGLPIPLGVEGKPLALTQSNLSHLTTPYLSSAIPYHPFTRSLCSIQRGLLHVYQHAKPTPAFGPLHLLIP